MAQGVGLAVARTAGVGLIRGVGLAVCLSCGLGTALTTGETVAARVGGMRLRRIVPAGTGNDPDDDPLQLTKNAQQTAAKK